MDFSVLTNWDIIFAAMLSLILTIIISKIFDFWRILTNSSNLLVSYNDMDMGKTLQKCYALFPLENFWFQGKEFKRGMSVRIVTTRQKIIEGKFIGVNTENILCLITKRYIIAHELNNIEEIQTIEV